MSNSSRPRQANPYDLLPAKATFQVTSADLTDGERMPQAQVDSSAGGEAVSPQLSWSGAPESTKGYAVTMYDPDAPTVSGFWHWQVVGLGADVTSLESGASASGLKAIQLRNDGGENGYMGAAPPPGDHDHRYIVTVHALDCDADELGLDESAPNGSASFTLLAHEIARAQLTVTWSH